MLRKNPFHELYSPYQLTDFIDKVGILLTDDSQNILYYSDKVQQIIRINLSKFKNLQDILPADLLFKENDMLIPLDEFQCSAIRKYNREQSTYSYFFIDPSMNILLSQINSKLAELEIIFELSTDGIFITDGQGVVLNVNPADEKKCLMSREEMIGKNVIDLVTDKAFYPSTVLKVLENKTQCTITQKTRNGQNVICTGTPIFDENNNISIVLCNNVDYTEIVEMKETLEITERLQHYYKTHAAPEHYRKFFLDGFYAKNEKMLEILDLIENMAEIDPTVLLSGQSGVGKSLLAKKIHMNSPQKNGNFIEINCGAIPENLLESELFGYVRGAFTGANSDGKIGLIELANNGTLFLDEIGDLPLELQVKLLHVIQNRTLRRIGGSKEIPVNIRIISASNKDLLEMVSEKKFRADLYYRLNVVPIHIPSLEERKEEIPDLLNLYLSHFNDKYRMNKRFHSDTINHLMNYNWPGNIRELINIVERLIVTSHGEIICPDILPQGITTEGSNSWNRLPDLSLPLNTLLENYEREIFAEILKTTRNSYEIAEMLGIGQSSVIRKLQKYHLNSFLEGKGKKEENVAISSSV